jgi:K+/H+ antiporter YhaU regulatory subunit KhtT
LNYVVVWSFTQRSRMLVEDCHVVERTVQPGSELDGVTGGESRVRERTGANVVGA